jgi:hypothetical protein
MSGKNNEYTRNSARYIGLAMAALWAAPVLAGAQDQAPKGNLEQRLRASYKLTVMDKAGRVTQAGTVLAVKKEGLQANPPKQKYYYNDYEDGQITANTISSALDGAKGRAIDTIKAPFPTGLGKKVNSRALAVDEKVYVLRMDISPASIDFYVQSCGDLCKPDAPDPAHRPYLAEVSFHFNKLSQNTDFNQVQPTIRAVLAASEDSNASADQSAQASAQPQQQDAPAAPATSEPQLAPIAPPKATPEPVRLGDTTDQVVAKLGMPNNTVETDTKEIYIYKDSKLKVTFTKGKVTDFE